MLTSKPNEVVIALNVSSAGQHESGASVKSSVSRVATRDGSREDGLEGARGFTIRDIRRYQGLRGPLDDVRLGMRHDPVDHAPEHVGQAEV